MFWQNLINECNEKGISPSTVAINIGLKAQAAVKWKNGSIPRDTTLKKIADYFGTTVADLLSDDAPNSVHVDDVDKLTAQERALVEAYRSQPEMQDAVDRILNIDKKY